MRKLLACTVLLSLGAAGLAAAQGTGGAPAIKPTDIIAARQAGYDLMAGSLIGMKQAVDNGSDVKPLTDSVRAISKWGHAIPTLFPAGTESGNNTKAKPEIWSDRAGFEKAAGNLVLAADKLAQLSEANDKAGFATQYKAMTDACGACHRTYRAR